MRKERGKEVGAREVQNHLPAALSLQSETTTLILGGVLGVSYLVWAVLQLQFCRPARGTAQETFIES